MRDFDVLLDLNKLNISQEIPAVKRIEIDSSIVRAFKKEGKFTKLSVDLLIEIGSYVCIAGSILPPLGKPWNRNEAVLIGHIVRLYKLISALLDQTCQHKRETSFIFARLAFECIVNTIFLIKNDRDDIAESYINYSMQHEKRLRERIRTNIVARNGEAWPIENRMIASIERSAKNSGVDLDQINQQKNWGGKNLYEKARDVGLEEAYLGAFGGPSHSVHGNWQDLLDCHLDVESEGFKPNFGWRPPRPQLLTTIGQLTILTLEQFFSKIIGTAANPIAEKLPDLENRLQQLIQLHEEFLARR